MKKIVIITYDMPPFAKSFGSCQRIYFLAKQLIEKNYDVTVVSKFKNTTFGSFGYQYNFNNIYLTINGNIIEERDITNFNKSTNIKFIFRKIWFRIVIVSSRFVNKIYRETNIFHSIEPLIWIWINKYNFNKIIDSNKPENVIISAPPFHLHSLSKNIKQKNKAIRVILDYRDPWNFNVSTVSSKIEQRNVNYSDLLSVFSEKYRDHLMHLYTIPKEKILDIYNGYSSEAWKNIYVTNKTIKDKIIFTYAGSYSFDEKSFADIKLILKAIEKLKKSNRVLFRFIGAAINNEEELWKNRLGEIVEFLGMLKHKDTLEFLVQSDVQIVLFKHIDQRSKFMLTTKFFDYLKSRKIIWGIGDPASDFCMWIKKYNLGFTSEPNIDSISSSLTEIINYFENRPINEQQYKLNIEEFSRENQYDKLIYKMKDL